MLLLGPSPQKLFGGGGGCQNNLKHIWGFIFMTCRPLAPKAIGGSFYDFLPHTSKHLGVSTKVIQKCTLTRGFATYFSVINHAFTNISVRGFAADFGKLNTAYDNILAMSFTIDLGINDYALAKILARGIATGFGELDANQPSIFGREPYHQFRHHQKRLCRGFNKRLCHRL